MMELGLTGGGLAGDNSSPAPVARPDNVARRHETRMGETHVTREREREFIIEMTEQFLGVEESRLFFLHMSLLKTYIKNLINFFLLS